MGFEPRASGLLQNGCWQDQSLVGAGRTIVTPTATRPVVAGAVGVDGGGLDSSVALDVANVANRALFAFTIRRPGSAITVKWKETTAPGNRADQSFSQLLEQDLQVALGDGTPGNSARPILGLWRLMSPTPTNVSGNSYAEIADPESESHCLGVFSITGVHQTDPICAWSVSYGAPHHGRHGTGCGGNALILEAAGWMIENSAESVPAMVTDANYPPATRTLGFSQVIPRTFGLPDAALGGSWATPTTATHGNNVLPWSFMDGSYNWVGIAIALRGA